MRHWCMEFHTVVCVCSLLLEWSANLVLAIVLSWGVWLLRQVFILFMSWRDKSFRDGILDSRVPSILAWTDDDSGYASNIWRICIWATFHCNLLTLVHGNEVLLLCMISFNHWIAERSRVAATTEPSWRLVSQDQNSIMNWIVALMKNISTARMNWWSQVYLR